MASKAVGTHYGLSKNTPLVIIKSALNESDVLWAFGAIANEMYRHGGSLTKSVILFAYGSIAKFNPNRPLTPPEPWRTIRDLMRSIISLDGIIVVPSGNGRDGSYREDLDVFPALFTRLRIGFLPLTLVGSCDNYGFLAPFSQQSPYIKAWAPGINVRCAKKSGAVEVDSGTSLSAGMVSSGCNVQYKFELMCM